MLQKSNSSLFPHKASFESGLKRISKTTISKTEKSVLCIALVLCSAFVGSDAFALMPEAAAAANLSHARNGSDLLPVNPMQWSNGNLGPSTAHYAEEMSSPYQCIMTGVKAGVQVTLTIGYDNKNGGKHAFDYLTHYNRVLPHNFLYHSTPEVIDPLAGSGLAPTTPFSTYPIPAPSTAGSPVTGQPAISFNSLFPNDRILTLYNGTIDSIYYVVQGNLTASQSETRVAIRFTPSSSTAVLLWGGHLASRNDWGYTSGVANSAGGISGSPFHMRLVEWTINNLGSQDRSLSGSIVTPPPASPLPVDLLTFTAAVETPNVVLEWSTAMELNNDFFTIERASSDMHFEFLTFVSGAGNSTAVSNYKLYDYNPMPGINYYRLSQTDYDGHKETFAPVAIKNVKSSELPIALNLFPNPSTGNLNMSYFTSNEGTSILSITDSKGTRISSKPIKSNKGINKVDLSTGILSEGIYFLSLSTPDGQVTTSELIKK